jgi:selenide, water dikinase
LQRLTSYSHCGGCASKLAAGVLARVLGDLPAQHDERVLVDYRTSDDAGVYLIDGERAIVQTVDFFTPIVDDPVIYGRIAATNALSDVYAMGGRPLTALAVAAFPKDADPAVLGGIFSGGMETLREAGVALLGGHTVQDQEIKFGYAVTGEVHPARYWANAGARPGDVLFLTKAIGTGVITTALKFDRAPAEALAAALQSMLTLNRGACDALRTLPDEAVHACTDVTGFSLVGHASEMAVASGCTLAIDVAAVPLLPGALALVPGNMPGGGRTNAEHFAPGLALERGLDADLVQLLHDPQTSGGLLAAVDPGRQAAAEAAFAAAGVTAWPIGRVLARSGKNVTLR